MPKTETFITRVSRNAMISAAAGSVVGAGFLSTTSQPVADRTFYNIQEYTSFDTGKLDESAESSGEVSNPIRVSIPIEDWTKKLEKEFRALALEDAKGCITPEQQARLDELTAIRFQLQNPRSDEEILLEIKRDRVLANLSKALEEYVEFTKATSRS